MSIKLPSPSPLPARRLAPVVQALQAMRGVQCTVAVTLLADLGYLTRFDTPSQLMSYLGFTASEDSRGARRRQGPLTTAGHTCARRARIEGAWAYRYPATVSRPLPWRLATLPQAIQPIGWKTQVRWCTHCRHLMTREKHATQVVVTIARARAACIWAIAREVPVTRYPP